MEFVKDKLRIEIEERQKIIEIVEERLIKDEQKHRESILTEEEKKQRTQAKEAYKRKWVFEFFKEITNRDMTEEEI